MTDDRSPVSGRVLKSDGTYGAGPVVEPQVATGPFDITDDDWSDSPGSARAPTLTGEDGAYRGRRRLASGARRMLAQPLVWFVALGIGILLVGATALVRSLQSGPEPVVAPPPTPAVDSPVEGLDRQGGEPSPSVPATGTPTRSPSATPAERTDSFQAEAAALGDRAQVVALAGAAGGEAVKINGRGDTFVRFDVTADGAGRYELAIAYACEQDRDGIVTVNDGAPAGVAFAGTGESTIGVVNLAVDLAGGANTILVGTPGGAPVFIDQISVTG